uniref:Uncharacterized protein n=1 Tax=Panagrolaimus sp. ES5 TaxID=591445 RepID=A0AC34FF96_9BILA
MQYGGESSFQPSNLSKHIKHVRSHKSMEDFTNQVYNHAIHSDDSPLF